MFKSRNVVKSRILATCHSKANEEAGWWKICFILDAGNGGDGRTLVQKLNHSSATGQRAFKDGGKRLHAQSMTIILKLIMRCSDQHHLIIINTVNLQFQS